jgi:Na+-transporting NADH:ubiquinone oxidoreductase subunit A
MPAAPPVSRPVVRHTVSRGLDLPIAGAPASVVQEGRAVSRVAVLPADHLGTKPRLQVQEGDTVHRGQPLWRDRTHPELVITSPAGGTVTAIPRGERRAVQSIVITVDRADGDDVPFASHALAATGDRSALRALLLESGLWMSLRTRPFGHVPRPTDEPDALFVTAMDTSPLAGQVDVALADRQDDVQRGLTALRALTDAPLFVCRAPGSTIGDGVDGVQRAEFAGKHPAGVPGFHMHTLFPVSRTRVAWQLAAHDVARLGALLRTGRLDVTQVVALGGPAVREPRHLRTRLGAHLGELLARELHPVAAGALPHRVISGSVLTGRQAGGDVHGYLSRHHAQVSVLPEAVKRRFLGFLRPDAPAYSSLPVYLGGGVKAGFDTMMHGGARAMVPIGAYERVLPHDLMATHLLRAIQLGDAEWAEPLGALELDEEDVALCSYVCPGKADYGTALRALLETMAAER